MSQKNIRTIKTPQELNERKAEYENGLLTEVKNDNSDDEVCSCAGDAHGVDVTHGTDESENVTGDIHTDESKDEEMHSETCHKKVRPLKPLANKQNVLTFTNDLSKKEDSQLSTLTSKNNNAKTQATVEPNLKKYKTEQSRINAKKNKDPKNKKLSDVKRKAIITLSCGKFDVAGVDNLTEKQVTALLQARDEKTIVKTNCCDKEVYKCFLCTVGEIRVKEVKRKGAAILNSRLIQQVINELYKIYTA